MPGLELEINGDSKNAQDALNRLTLSFDKFEKAVDKFSAVIDKLDTQVGTKLPKAFNKAGKAIKGTASASDQATLSLLDLGRVAQDAPYGFRGIANNINPAFESLNRLVKGAGGAGGALKALGQSILSPAGIGLALSIGTSLLVAFGDKLFAGSKAAEALKKSIEESAGAIASDLAKLTTLTGLIQNTATATGDREKALKAFNQEYDKYLKNLGIEEVKLANVNEAYNKIIDSMLKQAVIKGIQDEISEAVNKTAQSMLKLQVEEEKKRIASERALTAEQKAANKAKQDSTARVNLMNQYQGAAKDGFIAQQAMNAEVSAANSIAADYDERLKSLRSDLMKTLEPLLNLTTNFSDLGIQLDNTKDKTDATMRKLISEAKKVAAYFDSHTIRVFQFDEDPELSLKENAQRAKEFIQRALDASQRQTFDLKINARLKFDQIKIDERTFKDIQKGDNQTQKALEREIERMFKNNPIRIQVEAELALGERRRQSVLQQLGLNDPKNNILPKYIQDSINLANTINGLLTPAFQGFFQAIQQGENPLKALFDSLGQAINQLIQKLIAAVVQAAILSAIFPGGIGGVKGFGGFFKNVLGFAQGGLVSGPTLSLIGEGLGTSRSNPEVVAPLDQLRSMLGDMGGNGNVNVVVSGRIRGNDLALSNARTSRRNRRLGA